MHVPALSGATPPCRPLKNLFLRIDPQGFSTAIIPYVRLEPEVLFRAAEITAAGLSLSSGRVAIDNRVAGSESGSVRCIGSLCPASEIGLSLIASVARTLLMAAAAERLNIAVRDCKVENGLLLASDMRQRAPYADVTSDAALLASPDVVILPSGQQVALASGNDASRRRFQ